MDLAPIAKLQEARQAAIKALNTFPGGVGVEHEVRRLALQLRVRTAEVAYFEAVRKAADDLIKAEDEAARKTVKK